MLDDVIILLSKFSVGAPVGPSTAEQIPVSE